MSGQQPEVKADDGKVDSRAGSAEVKLDHDEQPVGQHEAVPQDGSDSEEDVKQNLAEAEGLHPDHVRVSNNFRLNAHELFAQPLLAKVQDHLYNQQRKEHDRLDVIIRDKVSFLQFHL